MKLTSMFKSQWLLASLLMIFTSANAPALERPIIWADSSDRTRLLEIIGKYEWGAGEAIDEELRHLLQLVL